MNSEQKELIQKVDRSADLTVKYGKTIYQLTFRFAEKGKATMNDKVLKLIRSNPLCEPTS